MWQLHVWGIKEVDFATYHRDIKGFHQRQHFIFFIFPQPEWPKSIEQMTAHAGKDGRKGEFSLRAEGQTCTTTMKICVEFPQKTENQSIKTQLHHSWAYTQKILYLST